MLSQSIDTVVLACTHFPFVIPLIQEIVGGSVSVIDPAPSVARQTLRLLEASTARVPGGTEAHVEYFTSGDAAGLERMLKQLLGLDARARGLEWLDETRLIERHVRVALKGNAASARKQD
jgi:glutamate racemase